ncbi:MAG: cellulose biosynthesis cyclic di-GMP-binding regulatory protein BcsB [Succinivibrionaceae bacterium]|nr:cellulose biosynthesis cyclic di-GMP-binding regulatory protein BcsB [Succinivibrionaceae bacterium]
MKKNNTLLISWLFLSFLAGGTASAETGQPQETGSTAEVSADAAAVTARTEEIPSVITDYYLAELDNSNPSTGGVSLTGAVPTARLYFPVARDEIIRKSQMEIVFTPSPSLIPVNSHLNVYPESTSLSG